MSIEKSVEFVSIIKVKFHPSLTAAAPITHLDGLVSASVPPFAMDPLSFQKTRFRIYIRRA